MSPLPDIRYVPIEDDVHAELEQLREHVRELHERITQVAHLAERWGLIGLPPPSDVGGARSWGFTSATATGDDDDVWWAVVPDPESAMRICGAHHDLVDLVLGLWHLAGEPEGALCPTCEGRGQIQTVQEHLVEGPLEMLETCPTCGGPGRLVGQPPAMGHLGRTW